MDHCGCICHVWARGNQRACAQEGDYMSAFDWAQRASVWEYHMHEGVDVRDVVEAALACRVCIDLHTPALSGKVYPLRRPPREQADGWTDPEPSGDT